MNSPEKRLSASEGAVAKDPADTGGPLVPAVARAVAILDYLSQQADPVRLARLSAELGLPKSSTHALCNTLVACDYVRKEADGSFRLGPRVVSLAESFLSSTDVAREFNAIWVHTRSSPEETVLLSVLSGNEAVYVAVRNSIRPLGLAFRVGLKFPAWLSASGKAMLAHLPIAEVSRRFADGLEPHLTRKGPRTLGALQKELDETRRRGYSIDDEGIREGVFAVGAPIFDASGNVTAAVSVCVTKATVEKEGLERHRDVALDVARELCTRLGGRVPAT
ncbi:IclR family transcriptional regulator [Burkholderia cepacia]|uniref:IclR family transcriptional regulator n=1 Tax=Burkholderia cepacia TaxID=292 RepID=UPI003EE3E322